MLTAQPAAAADLPLETIAVAVEKISCDGNGGALGHPRVFLTLDKSGQIDCPYCGKRYVKDKRARAR